MSTTRLLNFFDEHTQVKTIYTSSASPTTVYLYENKLNSSQVILKVLDKKKIFTQYQLESARREIEIHSFLKHPNIVQLFDSKETENSFQLLMEYISRHDYFTERIELNNKPFNMKEDGNVEKLRSFSFDILSGIDYMHRQGVIHMDLKPANLMVEPDVDENEYPLVKVADFGLSRRVAGDGVCVIEKRCGTDKYIAPEVKDSAKIGLVSDMWAFGMILHNIAVGYLPFALKWTPGQPVKFMPRHWKNYENTGLTQLISECLQIDPKKRMTSTDALTHEWFSCLI